MIPALFTLILFFFRVFAVLMCAKVAQLREVLAIFLTFKWFLSCMSAHVNS